MKYNMVGNSGLSVSELCLGTMMFGDQTEIDEGRRIVDAAREAGVNFIDTAEGYAGGKSETMVGELVKADRHKWIVATKVGNNPGKPVDRTGLSRRWMTRAIDLSLKRLQTDYIDIWYLHHVDWETPLEETITAMGDVIASGKVNYWGFSNHRPWQIGELVNLSDKLGVPRPIIAQPYYNAVNRMPENDLLPACEYYGIGVVPYSPLARGILTGKYKTGGDLPADSRAGRGDKRMLQTEVRDESIQVAAKLAEHAKAKGGDPIGYAVRWVLNCEIITSVLAGPRTLDQWNGYVKALDYPYDAEDEALLDGLVAAGHPSTPGFTDPRYPATRRARIG